MHRPGHLRRSRLLISDIPIGPDRAPIMPRRASPTTQFRARRQPSVRREATGHAVTRRRYRPGSARRRVRPASGDLRASGDDPPAHRALAFTRLRERGAGSPPEQAAPESSVPRAIGGLPGCCLALKKQQRRDCRGEFVVCGRNSRERRGSGASWSWLRVMACRRPSRLATGKCSWSEQASRALWGCRTPLPSYQQSWTRMPRARRGVTAVL